jgi:23S rRNA (uracil1939-C5)-methyltransferase
VDDLSDAHGAGRRRITVHARDDEDGNLHVGFAAPHSHAIVAIEHCPILDPGLNGALDAARALADVLKPANKPLDIQVTAADNGLDVDVRGSGPLP